MDIDFATLAQEAHADDRTDRLYIHGALTRMSAPDFPARVALLTVPIRFLLTPEDDGSHSFGFDVTGPDGFHEELPKRELTYELSGDLPDRFTTPFVARFRDVVFPQPGEYRFRIYLDHSQVTTLPLVITLDSSQDADRPEPIVPDEDAVRV